MQLEAAAQSPTFRGSLSTSFLLSYYTVAAVVLGEWTLCGVCFLEGLLSDLVGILGTCSLYTTLSTLLYHSSRLKRSSTSVWHRHNAVRETVTTHTLAEILVSLKYSSRNSFVLSPNISAVILQPSSVVSIQIYARVWWVFRGVWIPLITDHTQIGQGQPFLKYLLEYF